MPAGSLSGPVEVLRDMGLCSVCLAQRAREFHGCGLDGRVADCQPEDSQHDGFY